MDNKNYEFVFERLEIWRLSVDLSVQIYELTRDFPSDENLEWSVRLGEQQPQFQRT
jgi:hypothetical protein